MSSLKCCNLALLFLVALWSVCSSATVKEDNVTTTPAPVNVEKRIKEAIDNLLQQALPHIIRGSLEIDLSSACMGSLFRLVTDLRELKEWAIRMLDSSGKPPGGMLEGTSMAMGSFDQCLDIQVPNEYDIVNPISFRGQYCTVEVFPFSRLFSADISERKKANNIFDIFYDNKLLLIKSVSRIGLCVPSSCTLQDFRTISDAVSPRLFMNVTIKRCEVKEELHLQPEHPPLYSVAGLLMLLIISGTIADLFFGQKKEKESKERKLVGVLSIFSLNTNIKKFLNNVSANEEIHALHGIRVISVLWNILGHIYFLPYVVNFIHFRNRIAIREFESSFSYGLISNYMLSVEAPFFVSGLVIAYCSLKHRKNSSGLSKALRCITEHLISLVLVNVVITTLVLMLSPFGSGPMWKDIVEPGNAICRRSWWANFLQIANFWKLEDVCLINNWIVSALFQVILFSILAVFPLMKSENAGMAINFFFLMASVIITGALTYIYQLPPSLDGVSRDYHGKATEYIGKVMIRPYTHLCAYCVGCSVGFLLVKYRRKRLHPVFQASCWLVTLGCVIISVYSLFRYRNGHEIGAANTVLYASFYRTIFAAALGWIAYACASGHAGLLKMFLSWKVFVILDKLTILVYCIHPMLILSQIGRLRERMYLGHQEMINNFLSTIFLSYIYAFVIYVSIEVPVKHLSEFFIRKIDPKDELTTNPVCLKNVIILDTPDKPNKIYTIA